MPKARHIARLRAAEKIPAGQFEDWLALAVRQLLGPQQLLFTRTGVMFGVSIGWHVYTWEGFYVGSFREAFERGDEAELFSASGHYLGERDTRDRNRLSTCLAKTGLRHSGAPELPALPLPGTILYATRDPLPRLRGWSDFPSPQAFSSPERESHGPQSTVRSLSAFGSRDWW